MVRRAAPWIIGAILTGLYAFALVAPIGDLIGLPQMGLELALVGWVWLVLAVIMPIAAYAIALLFGRGRSAAVRLLLLAAGLAVVAVLQLEMQLLAPLSSFFVG